MPARGALCNCWRPHIIAAARRLCPDFEWVRHRPRRPSLLVSSLVLDDTRQHGPTRDGLSSQLSGAVQHSAAPDRRSFQITRIYEGTNQIQCMVIAKKLLG